MAVYRVIKIDPSTVGKEKTMNKPAVINSLKGARDMVGQAQNQISMTKSGAGPHLEEWQQLGKIFDEIDDLVSDFEGRPT